MTEPIMGFGTFTVLFMVALWLGGALEVVWNWWRGRK